MTPEIATAWSWAFRALLLAACAGGVALVVALVRRERQMGEIDPVTGHPLDVQKVPKISNRVIAGYGLAYFLFAVVLGLGVLAFLVWQPAIIVLLAVAGVSADWANVVYIAGLLLVGAALFVAVVAAEPYLRKGVEHGDLIRRFGYVSGGMLGMIVVGWLLRSIATAALGA